MFDLIFVFYWYEIDMVGIKMIDLWVENIYLFICLVWFFMCCVFSYFILWFKILMFLECVLGKSL